MGTQPEGIQTSGAEGGEIPAGAVEVGEDVYMVPAGTDPQGCETFTMWSPTKPVIMVIHYRDGKGGFTADRSQADCPRPENNPE